MSPLSAQVPNTISFEITNPTQKATLVMKEESNHISVEFKTAAVFQGQQTQSFGAGSQTFKPQTKEKAIGALDLIKRYNPILEENKAQWYSQAVSWINSTNKS